MTRFANLQADIITDKAGSSQPKPKKTRSKQGEAPPPLVEAPKPTGRTGKKGIAGFFSPELSRTLNMMAVEEETTVQALMGEAFDLLMRARGKHAFGER